uniref:DUF7642 domain-containing protein n=1 Tax=Oryza nivara TaxID=4536 RepID=A0A0E0GAA3_ORYNI
MGQKLSEGFPCRPCARHSNTLAAGRWLSKKCLTACGLWLRVLTVPSRGGEPATNARGRRPWDPASPASTRSPLTHAGAGADPHSARLSVLNGPARIRPIPESSPIEPRGGERDGEESSRRILEVWTKTEEEILAETTAASSIRGGGFARAPTTAGPAPTPSSSPTRLQLGMLSGRAVTLHHRSDSGERLVGNVVPDEAESGEEAEASSKVLYRASFQELMPNYLQYDTIIWAVISLLLVLAWGVGLLMLLYLPYKRYVLKKDILSRKLYVTENKIVYKASRPSYIPFMGIVKKEIEVPLQLVIIREASKRIQEHQSWKYRIYSGEGPSDVTPIDRLDSPNAKVTASSRHNFQESKGRIPESDSILLHKLEEVCQSVKNLESLLLGSHSRA